MEYLAVMLEKCHVEILRRLIERYFRISTKRVGFENENRNA